MKTLALKDGDLVLGVGGFATITGQAKVVQDLRCALLEPLGNDRFHPGYGSEAENSLGLVDDETTRFSVQQEVTRVVQNYVAVQRDQMEQDALSGVRSRFTTAEVIDNVDSIKVTQVSDTIYVKVSLTTVAGQTLDVITAVNA